VAPSAPTTGFVANCVIAMSVSPTPMSRSSRLPKAMRRQRPKRRALSSQFGVLHDLRQAALVRHAPVNAATCICATCSSAVPGKCCAVSNARRTDQLPDIWLQLPRSDEQRIAFAARGRPHNESARSSCHALAGKRELSPRRGRPSADLKGFHPLGRLARPPQARCADHREKR